jgi:hypothetical protein
MGIRYSSLYAAIPAVATSAGAITTTNTYAYKGPHLEQVGKPVVFAGTVTVSTALALNDNIYLFPVPKGFRMASINLEWGDLDTDGSPTVDLDLGLITQNPDAYINGGTSFQSADSTAAGNSVSELATEIVFDEPATTAEDVVGFTVIAAAVALSATATITFRCTGYLA